MAQLERHDPRPGGLAFGGRSGHCSGHAGSGAIDPLQPSRSFALDNREPDDFAHFPVSEEEAFPRLYRTATMNRRGNFSMTLPSERAG
jgi:hypothetical protein